MLVYYVLCYSSLMFRFLELCVSETDDLAELESNSTSESHDSDASLNIDVPEVSALSCRRSIRAYGTFI